MPEMTYLLPFSLRHILFRQGFKMDANRVKAILEIARPILKKDVQRFLGFFNYYRRFIPNLANIKALLRDTILQSFFVVYRRTALINSSVKCKSSRLCPSRPSSEFNARC